MKIHKYQGYAPNLSFHDLMLRRFQGECLSDKDNEPMLSHGAIILIDKTIKHSSKAYSPNVKF